MAEQPGGEKVLPPSQRKLDRAREKGNVPKSQDLNAAFTLLMALLALWFLGGAAFEGILGAMAFYLQEMAVPVLDVDMMPRLAAQMSLKALYAVGPIMVMLLIAGVLINVAQVGFLVAPQALQPKFQKLNPITGFKKFVDTRALVEFLKSLTKLGVVITIAIVTVRGRWEELLTLPFVTPRDTAEAVGALIALVWLRVALAMLVIGLLDLAYQRWRHQHELRMTQQEAKQEMKELEGDPHIKQRVRQIQQESARRRMMHEVPKADVVVTNPVTYAVALRYDAENMSAPTVTAKGARKNAERIRDLAVKHDVPIVERPELARSLYRAIEIGQPVPEHLFRAVAEVLAYVYKIDRRTDKVHERANNVGAHAVPG